MASRPTTEMAEMSIEPLPEQPKIYFEEIDVTAKIAGHWLDRNVPNNRNQKPTRIRKYARDMANGKWILTGDAIKITAADEMIDGGQRMRAVLRAHSEYPHFTSVRMIFARNVPKDAMLVTDTGAGRTFADALKIEDAINQTQCGAIVRRVHIWNQGNPAFVRGGHSSFVDPTMTELLELYRSDRHQFDAAAMRGLDIRNQRVGNATAAGTAYYMLNKVDHNAANAFYDDFVSGAHSFDDYPVWTLRERLRRAYSKLDRADYLTVTEQVFFIIRAWNAYVEDKPLDKLQLPPMREITNLNFPKPKVPGDG